MREAWSAHLKSLAGLPELFRYLGYTRKLLAAPPRPKGASAVAG
jgi:hypothetical protein